MNGEGERRDEKKMIPKIVGEDWKCWRERHERAHNLPDDEESVTQTRFASTLEPLTKVTQLFYSNNNNR